MKPTRPKIALYDPSGSGGIAHYTFALAEGLNRIGCPVTIITSEDYELRHLKRNFDVWFLFKKSRLKVWFSKVSRVAAGWTRRQRLPPRRELLAVTGGHRFTARLIGLLSSIRFTFVLSTAALILAVKGTRIVHVQWILDRRADVWFMRLLHLLGIKIVYTVHDPLPLDGCTPENHAFYGQVYQYPDKLIVHSENNLKEMLELFSVEPERICVIPIGTQSIFFDHFGAAPTVARRDFGISDDARVILFFGLIKRYKGLECLLQAFETIETRCENVMLLIAGRIVDQDPVAHRYYSDLLARYAANSHIRFKDEYVPLNRVARYFSAADLVVLPYAKASQSGVLLTACAAGKPVVVTDTGGLRDVVKHGENGFVVPPNDPEAIADASIRILNDQALRHRFGLAAARLAATTYSWTTIGRTTVELYDRLLRMGCAVGFPDGEESSVRKPVSS